MRDAPVLAVGDGAPERALSALGAALRAVAYPEAPRGLQPLEALLSRAGEGRRPGGADPPLLARLLARHEAAPLRELEQALGAALVDDLRAVGLLRVEGAGGVGAQFQVERWGERFLLCDWPDRRAARGYVQGITNAGRSLAFLTPRRPAGRMLDLGTGSGAQALLASAHAREVVAVDLNERAVALAQATAWLNGSGNVEVRRGSWFAPVAGEEFDLIASNPPFVVSPDQRFLYRDGVSDTAGGGAEERCASILERLTSALAPGGIGVVLVNWGRRAGDDWSALPLRWLEPLPAQGVVIRYETWSPEHYAWLWNAASPAEGEDVESAVGRWLAYYEERGIDELCAGVVAVRRPGAGGGARGHHVSFEGARAPGERAGDQLVAILDGCAWSDRHDTEGVLATVPRLADGHEAWQRLGFAEGRYVADPVAFGFASGAGATATVDPRHLPFVLSIDGRRTVAELVSELASDGAGQDARQAVVEVVRTLARAGLLDVARTG